MKIDSLGMDEAHVSLRKSRLLSCVFLVSTAAAVLFASAPSYAADFAVNSTTDAVDANPGDGACATSAGVCTLRAAIQESNALVGNDTITLPAGTYTLTLQGKDENQAATGDLDVTGTGNLTITGAGAASTRIAQQATGTAAVANQPVDRVFHFIGNNNVTIDGVTIEKGYAYGGNGAGIHNAGAWVTLKNCRVSQNVTEKADNVSGLMGGGIYNATGLKMDIQNCTIANNLVFMSTTQTDSNPAFNGGGGIFNNGEMTVQSSTIENNASSSYGSGITNLGGTLTVTGSILRNNKNPVSAQFFAMGGAVANLGGKFILKDSLVSGNAAGAGGGVYNLTVISPAVASIVSSAISGNTAYQWGGGVDNWGQMRILASAITGNVATSANSVGDGGGITNFGFSTLTIEHSTISGNTAARAGGGLFNQSRAKLLHVTFSNNSAFPAFGSEVAVGGQIRSNGNGGTTFVHTLIAGADPTASCVAGEFTTENFVPALVNAIPFDDATLKTVSEGYNLDSGASCALRLATDVSGASPLLGALADAGGGVALPDGTKVPQWLHTPNAGSPVIDAIPNASCSRPGIDQRLFIRPEAAGGGCDIGAVENSVTKASLADLQVAVFSASSGGGIGAASLNARAVTGAEIRYAITLKNNGPDAAKGPITITQSFDGDVELAGFFPRDGVTCELSKPSSSNVITCKRTNGLAKDEAVEIAVNVKPVMNGKNTLNTTVAVASADASVVDHVVDNDSVSLSRNVSAQEPVANASPGGGGSGGGGAFDPVPLAALAAFGLWRGLRRRYP